MPPASRRRQRAAKACRRCSKRKVKCDAAVVGSPCSRCRMDEVDDCVLIDSQRGLYPRTVRGRAKSSHTSTQKSARVAPFDDGNLEGASSSASQLSPVSSGPVSDRHVRFGVAAVDTPGQSLAELFEDFIDDYDHGGRGIILFGEASPLTFALEEHAGEQARFYDARPILSENKRLVDRPREVHPPHCAPEDVAYLHAKGAFTLPEPRIFDAFVQVFITRFYPLYSIVNKSELMEAHERRTLPYIMSHAICLIGATFCDASLIHGTTYKSRAQARQAYYDKAKVLWSANYETDKFVLLETVLMLSFFGPQMNSVYNACSWLDFAFTIAESMGIHRSTSSIGVSTKDRGRVKRLWWTLAMRDAHCAALLGRPFRINIPQCDVPMLELEDFASELSNGGQVSALYQIEVARLSNIARSIIQRRFQSCEMYTDMSDLHDGLASWKTQLLPELSSSAQNTGTNIFATSLELLYQQYIILLHFDRAHGPLSPSISRPGSSTSTKTATDAAQAIASSASSLVTKQMVNRLPHEIFTGFFVAGIVYYRQIHSDVPLMSQAAQASLDNCRMLLHEARDSWDPAHWSIRIFDFLMSRTREKGGLPQVERTGNTSRASLADTEPVLDADWAGYDAHEGFPSIGDCTAFHGGQGLDINIPSAFDDFLLMSNFFLPNT